MRQRLLLIILTCLLPVIFALDMTVGSVDISISQIIAILSGDRSDPAATTIILKSYRSTAGWRGTVGKRP